MISILGSENQQSHDYFHYVFSNWQAIKNGPSFVLKLQMDQTCPILTTYS